MQQYGIRSLYDQHYKYQDLTDEEAKRIVNQLLPQIQRNDQQAFDTALRIVRQKAFFNVCRQVQKNGFITVDSIDDIMQFASLEYAKKSMTGFRDIGHENFYGYSLKFFNVSAAHFISVHYKKIFLREKPLEDGKEEQQGSASEGMADDPERVLCRRKQEGYKQECIALYIHSIEESGIIPYQLITYCYAFVLPMIFKDHRNNPRLLQWISRLNREGQKLSWADEKTGEIGGLIARRSRYLLKWARNAMYKMNVNGLSDEFTEIYNIRPLAGQGFAWGEKYRENLEKPDASSGRPKRAIGEMVITEEFQESTMKNWIPKVDKEMKKKMAAKIQKDSRLKEFAVEYAEHRIAERKCKNCC